MKHSLYFVFPLLFFSSSSPPPLQIKHLVDDAVSKGANVRVGGACDETLGELFYQPTVLMDTTTKMKLTQEEIFGPVAAIIK